MLARLAESRLTLPILTILTFVSRAALMLRSDSSLASRIYLDDSFYVFAVARNLARGLGLTADGLHPTNGLQPLIAYIFAPFFWLAGEDRWLGLRLTFIPLAIIDAISVVLIYRIVRMVVRSEHSRLSAVVASATWLVAYPIWSETMNGLETGLYSCILLAALYSLLSDRSAVLVGITLGLCVFARIDAVILVVLLVLYYVWKRDMEFAAVIALTSFVVSLPWWYYNWSVFGSLIPSSGYAQSVGDIPMAQNIQSLAISLADIGFVVLSLPLHRFSDTIEWLWAATGIALLTVLLLGSRSWLRTLPSSQWQMIILFLCFGAALGAIYTLFFHAPYFIHRYVQPLRIVVLVIATITLTHLAVSSLRIRFGAIALGLLGLAYGVAMYTHTFMANGAGDLYLAGVWARERPEAKIGMLQSGIAGFVADNVVNLDGKVNHGAMLAIRADTLGKYIVHERFTHLMDWDEFARKMVTAAGSADGCYRPIDSFQMIRVYEVCR